MSPEEKKHVQQYVGRAKLFIANINQRRQTMFKITTCIVERQRAYLEHGVRSLQPLSRAGIAEQVGHSREHRQPRHGQQVRDAAEWRGDPVLALLYPEPEREGHHEGSDREGRQPLTDTDIVERLKEQGIHIARRTVAKYRMQLKILPSALALARLSQSTEICALGNLLAVALLYTLRTFSAGFGLSGHSCSCRACESNDNSSAAVPFI